MNIECRASRHSGGVLLRGVSVEVIGPLVILKLTLLGRPLEA
jgi:hypothetical protein